MATLLQPSNTIDFNSARISLSRPLPPPIEALRENYGERRYRMAASLQTTLEIEQLLQLFLKELSPAVELDGLQYLNDHKTLQFLAGCKASHSCGYRLITALDHLGEIVFYRSTRFSDRDLEGIEVMLSALICPLRNALLYHEALTASLTDPLTGAGNRIALTNTLAREISLSRRHQHALSLLVLDIDKFKLINDRYGHSVGDTVLKQIVRTLKQVNRQTDLSFRYGGEEFVVLLNRTNAEGALIIAERIRRTIADTEIALEEQSVRITVSVGVTTFCDSDSPETLFNRADKALYLIKSAGGNKVIGL
ncbi:MAG: GGDEF domain-containing protein [Gammaproteobacteria bacterium]|nr:GGDEF domain-containing protein [Gammaproteobacteria bacterium]